MRAILGLLAVLLVAGCGPVAREAEGQRATERTTEATTEATERATSAPTSEAAGCGAACVADYRAAADALDACIAAGTYTTTCHDEMVAVAEKGDVVLAATSDPTLTKDGQTLQGYLTDWAAQNCKATMGTGGPDCLLLQTQISIAAQQLAVHLPDGGL